MTNYLNIGKYSHAVLSINVDANNRIQNLTLDDLFMWIKFGYKQQSHMPQTYHNNFIIIHQKAKM